MSVLSPSVHRSDLRSHPQTDAQRQATSPQRPRQALHGGPAPRQPSCRCQCAETTEQPATRRSLLQGAAALWALTAALPASALPPKKRDQNQADFDGGKAILVPANSDLSKSEQQVLSINRRVQAQNSAPLDFPAFVREGYDVKVLADGFSQESNGIIYQDVKAGEGKSPVDGQEVTFDYTAYNESGARIDSTYGKGRPASVRLGVKGLIPGFELGLKSMRPGGKRRLVVPPDLGPPVGPSTFFSAKQCEVFDVELRNVKSCRQEQFAMFSKVVCE